MAEWKTLDVGLTNSNGLQSTVDIAEGVLGPLAAALDALRAALSLVSAFVFDQPNPLNLIVEAAVDTLDQVISDLLQNNASLCVHLNLRWDPDWKYRKSPGDPAKVLDYVNDGVLPFTGTGVDGWLLDVGYSVNDPSHPFKPLSDVNTEVQGIVVLKGSAPGSDLLALGSFFEMFSDFSPALREWLNVKERLETATDEYRTLLRMGAMAFDAPIAEASKGVEQLVKDAGGTPVAEGDDGSNAPNSTVFVAGASSLPGPGTSGSPLIRAGDVLKFRGDSVFYKITRVNYASSPAELYVNPPILRGNESGGVAWRTYRGGLVTLLDDLPTSLRQFRPKPGAGPVWLSVPVAGLLPGVGQVVGRLHNLSNSLRAGRTQGASLQGLVNLLEQKVSLIEQTLEELSQLIGVLQSVLEFFDDTHVFVHRSGGGVAGWVNEALAGANKPDFGPRGVVVGFTALALTAGARNHLESFFELLGVRFQDIADVPTSAEQDRRDTWDQYF